MYKEGRYRYVDSCFLEWCPNEARKNAMKAQYGSEETMERVASPVVVEAVEGRADVPSSPGPFSEDVTMDDFLPRPTRGSVVFLAFSDW